MKRVLIMLMVCVSICVHPENTQTESFVIEKRSAVSMKEYRANCATDLADLLTTMIDLDERKARLQNMIVTTLFDMAQNGKAFSKAKRSEYDACHASIKKLEYLSEQMKQEYAALQAILVRQNA